jgi:indole-3-glycerol phosphate synthase
MGTDILSRIVAHKKEEIKAAKRRMPERLLMTNAAAVGKGRPFFETLSTPGLHGVNIIAEIKRASPSKGLIRADLNPPEQARRYEAAGAAAVSVLTDRDFFQGGINDLTTARSAVALPVLRKEFIVSSYQIYESRAVGADAVLLIVRILSDRQLRDYLALCRQLQMDVMVEVHSEKEFAAAALAGARLIGINNRDLDTFTTDIGTCIRLAGALGDGQVAVAESGIRSRADIEKIAAAGIFNFLIGESLVRADNTEAFLGQLLGSVHP